MCSAVCSEFVREHLAATILCLTGDGVDLIDRSHVPWVWKGVSFPHGTEMRAEYSGRKYFAKVDDGAIVYDGKRFKSPSPAANAITGNAVNGWKFWECKMPGKNRWVPISKLRKN
ncbi:MAG: DUF2924 domain-containing protein [Pyrinomonadaceae bacterium]